MAKKAFSWDSEVLIGGIKESDKVEHEVKLCSLNGKEFIVSSKKVLKKDG